MEKKIYVVSCSSGSYDSFQWWIGGIFDDLKMAEDVRDSLNQLAKTVQNACPIKYHEDMTDEDDDKYWLYFAKNQLMMEWSDAEVKEYPLNTPIYKKF